jgi:hypothetical protein
MRFWFSPIKSRDDALVVIKRGSTTFFILAGLQIAAAIFLLNAKLEIPFYPHVFDALWTAVVVVVLATILRTYNSRAAAVVLVLFYMFIAAYTLDTAATEGERSRAALLPMLAIVVALRAAYVTFRMRRFSLPKEHAPRSGKSYDVEKWQAFLKYDPQIALIAKKLQPLGEKWVDQFARDFLALNDKAYLPEIVQQIIADARQAADQAESAARARQDWRDF